MSEPPRLRLARLGVSGAFLLLGFTVAAWATNLPTVQHRTGIGSTVIGLVIVVLGLGTIVGAQICGQLLHRFGARVMVAGAACLLMVALNLLPLARGPIVLGAIAVLLGCGTGCLDVAMNHEAAVLQRGYSRPIMSSFHALFSVGNAVGAGFAAILQAGHTAYWLIMVAFTAVGVTIAVASLLAMAPGAVEAQTSAARTESERGAVAVNVRRQIVLLGALAFALLLCEGVAGSWAALEAVHVLHEHSAAASLAYGTFAVCMTLGRFLIDRVIARFGPVHVVRWGTLIASAGIAIVILSRSYPLTLLGWAVYGVGLSGGVPQVFTAAANLPSPKPGAPLAQAVGIGYVGELGGPAVIGLVAGFVGLTSALCVPLALCLLASQMSGIVRVPTSQSELVR